MNSRCFNDLISAAGYIAHYLVAAGDTDNTEKTGAVIDRHAYGDALTAKVLISWAALAVTDTKTLKVTLKRYESDDDSTWSDAVTLLDAVTLFTAADPVLTGTGVKEYDDHLAGRKRYVKYSVTADLNASGTDTACYGMAVVLGGQNELPAS